MKKVISFILTFLMIMSLGLTTVSAIDVVTLTTTKELGYKSNTKVVKLEKNDVIAQYFKTDVPINGVSLRIPSYSNNVGSVTIRVYDYKKDLKTTLKQKPIAESKHTDFPDCSWLALRFFTRPAGEYLITVSEPEEDVGVWFMVEGDESTITYQNGTKVDGFYLQSMVYEVVDPSENDLKYTGNINAFSKIEAYKYTAGIGLQAAKQTVNGTSKMPVIAETQVGGYVVYKNVDFGSDGAAGAKFMVNAGQVADLGEFLVVLDDLSNEAVARVVFEAYNEEAQWEEVPYNFDEKITGIHDVYVVFKYDGSMFAWMQFTKENPGLSRIDQRLKDYSPVPESNLVDYMEDTWVTTDSIGRTIGSYVDYGERKDNKEVMMFYHTWLMNANSTTTPANISEIIKKYPHLKNDYSNPIWEIYASNAKAGLGIPCHWNESLYGFYTSYDEWVIRKNLEMLSAAGVDAVVCDCSNGNRTFTPGYMRLAKTIHEMRKDGIDAPKISFMLPWLSSNPAIESIERLYTSMYRDGLYSDSWYYVEGKPLLMAWPYTLTVPTGNKEVDDRRAAIYDFFTFKENVSGLKASPSSANEWSWMSVYPQQGFGKGSKGTNPQMVSVSPSQNSNDEVLSYTASNGEGVYGRSYTYKKKFSLMGNYSAAYGYNFQEQWDRAISLDPDYVFVAGWNEQIMIRFPEHVGIRNAMVDQFNDEYSRDIEPSKGYLGDLYYYQLTDNIRRFKGVAKLPVASAEKTINLNGDFAQWDDVGPEFLAYKNNVSHRNSLEYGYGKYYVNNSGRNDIVMAKVARDTDNLYFYVETLDTLTPSTDSNWMRLFINSDRNYNTGWNGYDYIINRRNPEGNKVFVDKYVGDYLWEPAGEGVMKVADNKLMISVSKATISVSGTVDIEFKWADNTYSTTDANDFYVNGDVAPLGRFNYRYTETTANDKKVKNSPLFIDETPHQKLRNCVAMKINSPKALAKSTMVQIDPNNENITPKVINSRTLLPVRFLAEGIGGKVTWSDISQTATISYLDKVVKIKVGTDYITVNNKTKIKLDVTAQTIDDRIYVPMRAICEAVGLTVHWDPSGVIVAGDDAEQLCDDYFFMESLLNISQEW